MADPQTQSTETVANEVPKAPTDTRAAARAAVLAEMMAEAPAETKADAPSEPTGQDGKAEPEAAPEPEAKAAPEPEPVEADEPASPAPVDADTAKRLAAIQKSEKRSRDLLSKERSEIQELRSQFERERKEWTAQLDEAKSFAQLKTRARYAPAEVLAALGLTEDDFEPAARDLYTRSKAGAQDPRNKEAALKMQRDREYQDKVSQLEAKLEAVQKQFTEKEQQAQYERAWQGYWSDVTKAASAEDSASPLLRTALSKSPAKTQKAVQQLAAQVFQETGEWPDAQDVLVHYEKQRRQELEDLGIDLGAPAADTTQEKKTAPSKTVAPGKSAGTPVKSRSRREDREDVLRALETGRLD